jgi:hypothetical protein
MPAELPNENEEVLRRILDRLDARVAGPDRSLPATDRATRQNWVITVFRTSSVSLVEAVEQRLISAGYAVSGNPATRGKDGRQVAVLHDGNSLSEVSRLAMSADPAARPLSSVRAKP